MNLKEKIKEITVASATTTPKLIRSEELKQRAFCAVMTFSLRNLKQIISKYEFSDGIDSVLEMRHGGTDESFPESGQSEPMLQHIRQYSMENRHSFGLGRILPKS